ncbi:MAG: hypothetical protein ACI837_003364 [Crocinitomicaceae bacterium]|jgi:hypothetical protein
MLPSDMISVNSDFLEVENHDVLGFLLELTNNVKADVCNVGGRFWSMNPYLYQMSQIGRIHIVNFVSTNL